MFPKCRLGRRRRGSERSPVAGLATGRPFDRCSYRFPSFPQAVDPANRTSPPDRPEARGVEDASISSHTRRGGDCSRHLDPSELCAGPARPGGRGGPAGPKVQVAPAGPVARGPGSILGLAQIPAVQEELKLKDPQKTKIRAPRRVVRSAPAQLRDQMNPQGQSGQGGGQGGNGRRGRNNGNADDQTAGGGGARRPERRLRRVRRPAAGMAGTAASAGMAGTVASVASVASARYGGYGGSRRYGGYGVQNVRGGPGQGNAGEAGSRDGRALRRDARGPDGPRHRALRRRWPRSSIADSTGASSRSSSRPRVSAPCCSLR